MEINQGYEIKKSVLFDNGRGFVLGENPEAAHHFATWQFIQAAGKRKYHGGHYLLNETAAKRDFSARVREYRENSQAREIRLSEKTSITKRLQAAKGCLSPPARKQAVLNRDSR